MNKIFYEKVGRRYKPISEYNHEWIDSFREGAHLVICRPGYSRRKYQIDPNYAGLLAAAIVAEDAISKAIMATAELRLQSSDRKKELTPGQKQAWENLIKEFGPGANQLEWASAREIAEAGATALQKEAEMLLSNESVKKAFDHFVLICKLTKEEKNES